jgi:hypothetical protein
VKKFIHYKELDLVSCIKFKRLQWAGHVERLPVSHLPRKALKAEFTGNRPVGRPRFKWEEGVKEDVARLISVATGTGHTE